MSQLKISIIGGTGYVGANIAAEAAARGHEVRAWSRSAPADPIHGVTYEQGDVTEPQVLKEAVAGADVVIGALSPRGPMLGKVAPVAAELAQLCAAEGVRLGFMAGAGSLFVAPGGPRLYESEGFPPAVLPESTEMGKVIETLQASDDTLDWFVICPAREFGGRTGGERTGHYRTGGHELFFDADGRSRLSGPDLAVAFLDEIENPAHHRDYFAVAY